MEDVRLQVRVLVGRFAPDPVPEVPSEARLIEGLGYHSLQLIDLAHAVAKQFSIKPLTERETIGMVTVKDLEDLVVRRLSGGSS
jgi:acyl carrier protein